MGESVWNIHWGTVLANLIYLAGFIIVVGIIIFYMRKLRSKYTKVMLAFIPLIFIILYFNFTPYFHTSSYLKSVGERQIQSVYHRLNWGEDYITIKEGSQDPPRKVEKERTFKYVIENETVTRHKNEFKYCASGIEHKFTKEGETTEEKRFCRTYRWDKWKYVLIGIGDT